MSFKSGYRDHFAREHLPAEGDQPVFDLTRYSYPERLNAAVELTDAMVDRGFGARTALIGPDQTLTYDDLARWTSRIAQALLEDFGLVPGNRVLIRGPNSPALVAMWLGVTKAGGVAVNTMAMLRKAELDYVVEKAAIGLALCDSRSLDELEACDAVPESLRIVTYDGSGKGQAEMDRVALAKDASLPPADTHRDDVALIAFTSGSTGVPKATMHFHRDLLIVADGYGKEVLGIQPEDVVIGSPPLAFTFGLGALAIFPLRVGAASVLYAKAGPDELRDLIPKHRATLLFTAPLAYRALLASGDASPFATLRCAVSAGDTLPATTFEAWTTATGVPILDGIGSTEMLHIFISNRASDCRAGKTGRPVPGYDARIFDDDMNECPRGEIGRLAVRGPTGCRYLDDPRQSEYVRDGWNLTGDCFLQEADGTFCFVARADDLILSAGYNIAGPEVENALLSHAEVMECAVVAALDPDRGFIVEAHIVLHDASRAGEDLQKGLQDHVKQMIAPYKYPRRIRFIEALPKTTTGKIQRFRLRDA